MTTTTIKSELLIIGGGIAGCIAAIALADQYQVVLIDKEITPQKRIGECLAPTARRILKQLNLLTALDQSKTHMVNMGTRSYWGTNRLQIIDHISNPDGQGWYLNRQEFESFLRQTAQERGVQCIWPAQYVRSQWESNQWSVTAKENPKDSKSHTYVINAAFVIDASGRQAHFARQQNMEREYLDSLVSFWATMEHHQASQMSLISPCKNGWWYQSPLPNNKQLVAFQTDADLVDRSLHKNKHLFIEYAALNAPIYDILKANKDTMSLHGVVAANTSRLKKTSAHHWVALGDAAISFDPLSSQGMFNAMASGMQLADLMLQHRLIKQEYPNQLKDFHETYHQQISAIWDYYLHHKKLYYNQELRWKEAPFWKRRHC